MVHMQNTVSIEASWQFREQFTNLQKGFEQNVPLQTARKLAQDMSTASTKDKCG
jgi:hypothetical protein